MKQWQQPSVNTPLWTPQWQIPKGVKALISSRHGGVSEGVYKGLNVGAHVGDEAEAVKHNRDWVQQHIPVPVAYLNQTHSTDVVAAQDALGQLLNADASVDNTGQVACAVMTADCLPILLCDEHASVVAAVHAGWRGLVGGVIENTVHAMNASGRLLAYLGPAIGPDAFEVGADVYEAFVSHQGQAQNAFTDIGNGKYLADIYALAKQRLAQLDIHQVEGGQYCTVLQRDDFFSYRRDGQTGRMVSTIWLE